MKSTFFSFHVNWQLLSLSGAASVLPAGLAFLLAFLVPTEASDTAVPILRSVTIKSAQQLEALFDSIDYSWPPKQQIPPLGITRIPQDMAELENDRKKALFLRALLPLILAENKRLTDERRWLEAVMTNGWSGDRRVRTKLRRMAEEYGLGEEAEAQDSLIENLYERVDVVPVGLALAQAANESGWGTSRFSREINNLFGEWTYLPEDGVLPLQRKEGADHYVRRFDTPILSVRSYLNNLNRNRAYSQLRQLRASLRRQGHEPDALTLAGGLLRYSARGKAYVAEIRSIIRSNSLNDLGPLHLSHSATVD